MKLMSWNVNGIRAVLKKNFLDIVAQEKPDILCLQETKAEQSQVEIDLPDYEQYWNSSKARKGYSGTLILTKKKPKTVTYDMNLHEHDQEGRVITADFGDFQLVNVYTPNSGDGLKRLAYRQTWDEAFCAYVQKLKKKTPVIVCGDLNVAHKEIDLTHPQQNRFNPGFTDEERAGINRLFDAGFLDSYREFYPDTPQKYTWWSFRTAARERNVGWRIDYFCISKNFRDALKHAEIHPNIYGSDHCPVSINLG